MVNSMDGPASSSGQCDGSSGTASRAQELPIATATWENRRVDARARGSSEYFCRYAETKDDFSRDRIKITSPNCGLGYEY